MPLWASPMMISNPGKALRIIAIDEVRRGMGPETSFCSFCSTQHMVIQKQFCFCVVCGACRFDQPVLREPVSLQDPDYRFLLPGVTPYNIQTGHANSSSSPYRSGSFHPQQPWMHIHRQLRQACMRRQSSTCAQARSSTAGLCRADSEIWETRDPSQPTRTLRRSRGWDSH